MSDEDIFQDVCASNGIEAANESTDLSKIEYLEMFFLGFPRIVLMNRFPNLKTLVIIGQDLKKMSPGLDTCFNLNELWICECQLDKIAGLTNCTSLKKLYLYTNKISKIENLNTLHLEVLWLNDNKIESIEGIQHMKDLKELNLAKNFIKTIGDSLINNKKIENLNLSANLINSFEDVVNLQNNSSLRILSFKDSQYGYCPITMLCNYSIFMIYHFPDLQRLDTLFISQKTLKDLSDATINKKKLWYNMRLNTINREIQELQKKLEIVQKLQIETHLSHKKSILCKIKNIERYIDNLKSTNKSADHEHIKHLNILRDRLNEIEKKLQNFEHSYQQSLKRIENQKQMERNFTYIELENGGNIKFEYGRPEDPWCKSCHELLLSRFCSADYLLRLIGGIKIHKIIRITNRMLLTKFEDNLFQYIDENEFLNNKSSLRKQVDYLMYCWRPQLGSQHDELYDIIKHGFKDLQSYKSAGFETAVPFSNSLSVSDYFRIESFRSHKAFTSTASTIPFKHGFTLLCKVYTNNFAKYDKSENSIENYKSEVSIIPENYKDKLGVFRQFGSVATLKKSQQQNAVAVTKEFLDTQRSCDCKSKQFEYFLFNKHLAVPEYLIEFEYMNKISTDNIYDIDLTLDALTSNENNKNIEVKHAINETNEFDKYNNDELIDKIRNDATIAEGLEELNLHNCELSQFHTNTFRNFRFLKKLVVSFNNLTSIKEISYIYNLEYLDASHNKIENLNGFKGLPKLSYFDISYNEITDFLQLLIILKQYFAYINHLNINANPFNKTDGCKMLCAYYLKHLKNVNNEQLSNYEIDTANKGMAYETILKHSINLITRPRTLKYSFVTDYCKQIKIKQTLYDELDEKTIMASIQSSVADINWTLKVTALCLDNCHIFKLANLSGLINLRWASFNNNYLTKIEGIENCTKLEELTIENNYLRTLEGIETLKNLRKLSLSNNEISFDNTKEFTEHVRINSPRLSYLAISNNKIKSLKFIQKLPSLLELYANFNQISNLREVFNLKQIPSLVILDLWCNPMCNDAKYRLFVIYHLKTLKSLDGYPIETTEGSEAREYFGGKLTCDFIAEKFSQIAFSELRSLDLPQCSIRYVDLGGAQLAPQQFENLRSLNLENNCLTSFSGLIYLKNLKTLCLNYNKIESIYPKVKSSSNNNSTLNGSSMSSKLGNDQKQLHDLQPLMENLEVLHLAYNGITDIVALQIGKLTSLKALFLQGNEIVKIEGLENLRNLRELVLDKNKIKFINETSFIGQTQRLVELHIEENRLKDLANIQCLKCLEKFYVANNKISDMVDIDRLVEMVHLHELSLINNPVTRRPHYRITVVDRLPRLRILDMVEINDDDRAKAELFFSEQYQQQLQQMQPQIIFNSNASYTNQTQLITNLNSNQIEGQYVSSPRLKPILFMEKMITGNYSSSLINNGPTNNGLMNPTNNPNNTLTGSNKLKAKSNLNNANYEKLAREFQAKHKSQY